MRLLLIVLAVALCASGAHGQEISGRAAVIDADTVQVNGEVIRFLDIDAPETDQFCGQALGDLTWECGQEAAFALIDWLGTSSVTCEIDGVDHNQRRLAHCNVGGEDVAGWLAESGWAVPYGDCTCASVRAASARAAAAGRGLWVEPFPRPWD
jgi:endonuclease YncB( thermonuclease family)